MITDRIEESVGGLVHGDVTEQIIGAAMEVHNALGSGFLEKVYENAMALELHSRGLRVEQQKPIVARYKGAVVDEYVADLLVEECVIVELKTVERLAGIHHAQMLNYLKATGLRVGLLVNFHGERAQWKQ